MAAAVCYTFGMNAAKSGGIKMADEKGYNYEKNQTSDQKPSLKGYIGAIPEILGYQLITKLVLFICVTIMSRIGGALL